MQVLALRWLAVLTSETLRVAPHRKPLSVTRQQESPPKLFGKAGNVHVRYSCYGELHTGVDEKQKITGPKCPK